MTKKEQIREIIRNFEWDKVHKAMTALDWKWALNASNGYSVPTIADLKKAGENQLEHIWRLSKSFDGELCSVACGGLLAECNDKELSLSFVLTAWDCCS